MSSTETTEPMEADDELRRWFATECLGWRGCYCFNPRCTGWDNAENGHHILEDDLSGWIGFGRVAEWCRAKGYDVLAAFAPDGSCVVDVILFRGNSSSVIVRKGTGVEDDPTIAALRAVRAACGGQGKGGGM